jgi:hypothetical protein
VTSQVFASFNKKYFILFDNFIILLRRFYRSNYYFSQFCRDLLNLSLADPEKLSTAENYRTEGNEHFKKGDLKKAMGAYHNALMYLKVIKPFCSREFC